MANLRQLMFNPYVVIHGAPLSRHAVDILSLCEYKITMGREIRGVGKTVTK